MLTKTDLSQIEKLVRKVVREEVESEVGNAKEELGSDLRLTKIALTNRIYDVESRVKNSEISIKREIKKLQIILDHMDNFLDAEVMADRKRVDNIEKHLGFPEPQIA